MKTFDYIVAVLILAFGCLHAAVAPVFHGHYDLTGMWFLSGGLMIIFLALLNFARISSGAAIARRAALVANVLGLAFAVGLIPLASPRQAPQVPAFAVVVLAAALLSLFRREAV